VTDDPVLSEMLRILETNPDLLPVRIRVIELLADRSRHADALAHCATALGIDPGNATVLDLLQRCTAALASGAGTPGTSQPGAHVGQTPGTPPGNAASESGPAPRSGDAADRTGDAPSRPGTAANQAGAAHTERGGAANQAGGGANQPGGTANSAGSGWNWAQADGEDQQGSAGNDAGGRNQAGSGASRADGGANQAGDAGNAPDATGTGAEETTPDPDAAPAQFDWAAAEREVGDIIAPAFVDDAESSGDGDLALNEDGEPVVHAEGDVGLFERPSVALADVGGMENVKQQLELSLLGPLRNPELAKAFGTSARGGLLLYGPPGCGKTFIAAAVAGELGANFYPIEIADILDIYTGSSERNLHQVFEVARRNAPCVLFIDEVDALGHKRSQMSGSATMRTVVNQLLTEMDSATADNEGVYLLGATNHPWDIDVALRRPGRFDRMILVTLPDREARRAILRHHLRDRPVSGIDLGAIAKRTDGFSGADLAHVCTSATQLAMADSIRTGTVRPITMRDIDAALAQVKPSAGAWFESARNVVEFANNDGTYDELAKYMREKKLR
jgi:AAA+ superfamily predicted ATPase